MATNRWSLPFLRAYFGDVDMKVADRIQGALNAVIERGLREYRNYSPQVVAWAISRDLVEHLTRCRYELVVTIEQPANR